MPAKKLKQMQPNKPGPGRLKRQATEAAIVLSFDRIIDLVTADDTSAVKVSGSASVAKPDILRAEN
jgi:hypothetical protein